MRLFQGQARKLSDCAGSPCREGRFLAMKLSLRAATRSGLVAEWLRRGLQILAPRFDSGRGLQDFLCDSINGLGYDGLNPFVQYFPVAF